jgi:hypothetical protein
VILEVRGYQADFRHVLGALRVRHSKIRLLQALPALLYSVLALKSRLIVPKMTLKSKIIIFLLAYKPLISSRIL